MHNNGAGPVRWHNIVAKEKVLVELVLTENGKEESRKFWIGLDPLEIHEYTGNTKALLKENLRRFFKPAEGSTLVSLSDRYATTYTEHKPDGGQDNLLETVSMLLVGDRGKRLREHAHQTTEQEEFKEKVRETVMGLIPFYTCFEDLRANEPSGAFSCTLDIASLIPALWAGDILAKEGFSAIKALTSAEISQLGKALLFNSVAGGDIKTIKTIFDVMPAAINFSKAALGLFDPGIGLAWGLKSLGFRLGKEGLQSLLKKMRQYHMLSPIREILEESAQMMGNFYPGNGYWHARSDAVMSSRRGRYVDAGSKRYGVFDWGENKNVLTIQIGDDLRLVNPQSGMGYGPLLRKSAIPGRLELIQSDVSDGGAAGDTAVKQDARVSDVLDVPAAPTHAVVLCRSKRTGEMSASGCGVVRDARFGDFGYSRQNPAPEPTYQFRLTDAEVLPSQFDVIQEHADATNAAKRVRVVNAADHGYARHVLRPDGVWSGEIPDELEMPAIFPAEIHGRIEHFAHPDSATGADYVVFSNSHLTDDGVQRANIEYCIPFGTYEELQVKNSGGVETIERRVIGIATVNPLTTYRFSIDPAQIPLKAADRAVQLERASVEEFQRFENFQRLQHIDRHVADPALVDAVRLRDASPELREKFDRVFLRSEMILSDAIAALGQHESEAIRIIARLTNQPEAQAHNLNSKLNKIILTLSERLHRTQSLMRYVKEQSPHVVSFFDSDPSGVGSASSEGSAYRLSMDGDTDLTHSNKPMIFLRISDYLDKTIATDTRVRTWLHELWHALFGTEDWMQAGGMAIYADVRGNRAALSRIRMAAGLPDSQPENHAATLEHLMMMLAYLMHEDTRKLIAPFHMAVESYMTKMSPKDLREVVGRPVQRPAPAPAADSTPSCSNQPAGAVHCHVPMMPAPRFGDHAYAQDKIPPSQRSQLTVNGAGEAVLQTINLQDIGFEEFRLNSEQRWIPVVPVISAQHDAATGSWKGMDATIPLGDQLSGEVMDIPDKDGKPVSYVRVEFFSGNAQDDRMMHIRYVPFISYRDVGGALIHHVVIAGRRFSFHWDRDSISSGGSVALHLTTVEEAKKLARYQALLRIQYKASGIDFSNMVRLRDEDIGFQREFEGVMAEAETTLFDAIAVFETMPGLVRTICERFSKGDDAALDLLIANIGTRMREMRDAFPDFINQSGDTIGIFTNQAGREFNQVEGAAIPYSMNVPIGFREMPEAMLFFNRRFCDKTVPRKKRIENILHEWSHARTGTLDSPTGPGGPSLYAGHHGGRYDLTRLMEAARAPGGDPAQHAAVVQHIIMMLANFRYPKTEHLSHPFIYGKNFYFSGYEDFILPA
jgi:hypothetical protein